MFTERNIYLFCWYPWIKSTPLVNSFPYLMVFFFYNPSHCLNKPCKVVNLGKLSEWSRRNDHTSKWVLTNVLRTICMPSIGKVISIVTGVNSVCIQANRWHLWENPSRLQDYQDTWYVAYSRIGYVSEVFVYRPQLRLTLYTMITQTRMEWMHIMPNVYINYNKLPSTIKLSLAYMN